MKWSTRIGRFAGIDVYVHATFLMLVAWVAYSHWREEQSVAAVIAGVGFILALFLCVVLHEFGHALTARRYGIRTRDITLLPIGGLARLERMPDDPRQELWVALAGPAVNVVIAVVLFAGLLATGGLAPLDTISVGEGSFLERLLIVNISLVLFNMLPAFPMDGGRVLRAVLAMRMDYARATQLAANIGQGAALLFGLVGLLTNPFLMFIALFVWIGAGQEAAMTQMRSALGGVPVERAMITDFRVLGPDDSLSHAVDLLLASTQQEFPVVEHGAVVGVLASKDIVTALARTDRQSPIGSVMQRRFAVANATDLLDTAIARLQEYGGRAMPVLRDGALVGMLTMDNVGEFVSVRTALSGRRTARSSA
jgi:Zn-dependent protease/CBS domain-containing protein